MGIFDFLKKSPQPLIEDEEITVETNKQHISQDGSYSWNDDEVIPFEILPDEVQEQFRNFYDKRTKYIKSFIAILIETVKLNAWQKRAIM